MKITQNNPSQVEAALHPDEKINSKDIMEYLQGYVPAEFPANSLRSPNRPGDVDVHRFYLANETYTAFELFAKSLSTSLSLALVAAVRILHFRYSGINQAAIGLRTIVSGPVTEGEMMQSHHTFVVCLPVDGDETLCTVVENTGQAVMTASQYSKFPFLDAVSKLGSFQGNACDPVLPVLVALEDGRGSDDGVSITRGRAQFDMEWRFRRVGDKFGCDLIYNRALFEKESIQAFATNIVDVIECIPLKSGLTVEEIPFSHALEQLIQAQLPIHSPPQPQEPRSSLAEAFKLAAAKHANKLALVDGRLLFTYRELDILSSALAKRISDITQGQEAHKLVSFCLPPSALAIVAILGIIKYGAAYVPLDVRFPSERRETLLNDSGAGLLITTSQSPEFHIEKSHVTRIDISDFLTNRGSLVAAWDAANLPSYPKRTDLAYIMYISSSTGRPNGVPIKQSSVLACVSNRDVVPFGPDYRIAQINNLARSSSIIDVWCTLLSGATLVCFTRYDVLDPQTLAQQFHRFKINCCFMTTTLFHHHLDLAPNIFRSLHTLMVGGEIVDYESIHMVRTVNPSVIIRNMYGITEACAISAAFSILDSDEMPEFGQVPIGRPFLTSQKLVTDTRGRLVPPGVIGELLVGGEGISCGYLKRPDETSRAFVDMEFKELSQPRSRFYRTGDTVKWCGGQLQFVGRLNIGQIKICGQRLELAEIEATIIRTGLVKSAAVTYLKPADRHDPFLVAYIVTHPTSQSPIGDAVVLKGQSNGPSGSPKVVETLREQYGDMYSSFKINEERSKFLGSDSMVTGLPIPQDDPSSRSLEQLNPIYSTQPERDVLERLRIILPTYMIPEAIYSTPRLPLLTSGKLDRRRVSAIAEADAGQGFAVKGIAAFAQPKDALETRVCEIFGQILSCGTVSPVSDFFSTGGHYLLATRLKTTIESEFNIRFALATILARPTPRDVASKIRALGPSANLSRVEPIAAPSPRTYLPLSFAQDRLLFLARLTGPEDTSYHCPYVLSLSGNLRVDALERTIHELASRHEVWRTVFVEIDGVPKARVLDIVPRLETVDIQSGTSSEEVQGLVKKYAMRPFLLDSEPAFRPTLFKISPSQFVLLLSIHHIVWDGSSQDVCRNELAEIYSSFSLDISHSLPPLDIQYREFTEWQRSDDFEHLLGPQIEYWKTHLLGNQPAEFPTDYSRPLQLSRQAKTHTMYCKPRLREQLHAVCHKEHVTMFMWLLTVFRAVHYQLTGQEDASLGYPIANRNRHETEKLIGFFANTQVFRLKVHPGVTFLDLLQQSQALLITAFENQDLPFERIVSILNPDRDVARNPLVQILFTHETIKTAPFSLGGIEASDYPLDMRTSRFDLEVYFRMRDDELRADIVYRTDLFKESTVVCLAERMQMMLERTVQDPHVSVHLGHQSPTDTVQPRLYNLRNYLHDYTPAELPLDYIRDAAVPFESQIHHFYLPKEACTALKLLTVWGVGDVSLPLVAAFRILQFRYSRSEDAAVGLRLADTRKISQNTVIVRLPVKGTETLSNVLEETRRAMATASRYSEVPFSDVAVDLQSQKSAACDSVVRVVLALEQVRRFEGNGAFAEEQVQFDMEWRFCSAADEFSCELLYNRALFKAESIKAFSSNFIDIVRYLLLEPDLTVEEIPFSHALEQLIQAHLPIYPSPQPQEPPGDLTEAFKLAATRHADRPALVDGRILFTYRELDILSSALAKMISGIARGQNAYETVSFCLPPSSLAIIAILGIIKYGAAYVPLDVRFPNERLETLLDDSGARLLITSSQSPEFATEKPHVARLDISDFLTDWRSHIATWEAATLPSYPKLTDLAYIMYTSGSTGRPKGVPIKQSTVLAFVSNRDIIPFGPDYRVAQINNLAWDASVIDVWCTLLSGATLICFNRYDVLDPPTLAGQFDLCKIQGCFMPSALFRQILDVAPHLFRSLQTLIFGGESIHYESLRKVRAINPSIILRNAYGPTEACVFTTTFDIYCGNDMPKSGLVPIGRPLRTVQALVVDSKGRLVPPGVTGELVIGGDGVCQGYLNRPSETSLSFVGMEFEGLDQPRSTFYRSGDMVKWRPDSQLQFVCRLNTGQVKIRGQRLELGEVEAAIVRTGLVSDAAVVYYKPEDGGDPYLVAYVVGLSKSVPFPAKLAYGQVDASEEVRPLQGKLLDHLRISVPSFMVPPTIRFVSSLPLLPNGKLDRIWLYSQTAADAASLQKLDQTGSFEVPYDDTEKRLCTIFEEVLGRSPVYRSSDFFANGGHSLLALRLSLRIQHAFNITFTVLDVFKLPTPKAMADKIRAATSTPGVGAKLDTPWLLSQDSIPSGTTPEDGDIPPLLVFSQKPNNPYIFCIPTATGLGSKFEALSQATARLNVIAFNDPRHCGPSLKTSFEGGNSIPRQALYYYECIVQKIRDVCGGKGMTPINIMGYSFGGHLAIEVARMAQRDGWRANLFVVDSSHPKGWYAGAGSTTLDEMLDTVDLRESNGGRGKLQDTIRPVTAANLRALLGHTLSLYSGHTTLFRTEDNVDHGFAPVVGSLDEVIFQGDHFLLLDESMGNLPAIAEKVCEVIAGSASGRG